MQRHGTRLKVGKSYQFGPEPNFFSRELFARDPTVHVRGVGDMPADLVLRDYVDPQGFRHYRSLKHPHYDADERGLIACAAAVLDHQAELLRELVFEQVRQESFPEKPSRLRCMWLIPHDQELLARWCASINSESYRVFEVEAEGRVHVGANKYLRVQCLSGNVLRENARRFWSPLANGGDQVEILCEGEIRIVNELKMGAENGGVWGKLKRLF